MFVLIKIQYENFQKKAAKVSEEKGKLQISLFCDMIK